MFNTFCSQWDNWNEFMQYSPRWICICSRNSRINITLVQMNNSTEKPKQTTKPKCYCVCFFIPLKMALLPICWINSIQFTWMLNSRWKKNSTNWSALKITMNKWLLVYYFHGNICVCRHRLSDANTNRCQKLLSNQKYYRVQPTENPFILYFI